MFLKSVFEIYGLWSVFSRSVFSIHLHFFHLMEYTCRNHWGLLEGPNGLFSEGLLTGIRK